MKYVIDMQALMVLVLRNGKGLYDLNLVLIEYIIGNNCFQIPCETSWVMSPFLYLFNWDNNSIIKDSSYYKYKTLYNS